MSSLTTLARPYAKAAFELARGQDALASWDEMLSLAGRIAADEAVSGLLENPQVSADQAVGLVILAGGDAFTSQFRDYLEVMGANRRLALLPEVTVLYRRLRQEAEKRLQVRVVSAIPLDEGQASRMRDALVRRFDCEIELDNETDESILGGAVIYAGDEVIDGSLRGRLERLANSL